MTDTPPSSSPLDKLNPRQRKFVEQYLDCMNAAEAARRSGYSKGRANRTGHELLHAPLVRAALSFRADQIGMTAGEAIWRITQIARHRLNDYLRVAPVYRVPRILKPLAQLIDELEQQISLEEAFFQIAGSMLSRAERKQHQSEQRARKHQLIRYQLKYQRDPQAREETDGEGEWIQEASLDLAAMVRAGADCLIKSISWNQWGVKIELYDSLWALDRILRLQGRYDQAVRELASAKTVTVYHLPNGEQLIF